MMQLTWKLADMEKLATAFFDNLQRDDCEYGAIGVDCKRPFGSSGVEGDILRIIGAKPEGEDGGWAEDQMRYAAGLYDNLIPYLKQKYGSSK
jgi:hypothetical protein